MKTGERALVAECKGKNGTFPDDFVALPMPKRGLEILIATFVNAGRNTNGVVVGQKIGRDQFKINNLEWGSLTAEQWANILNLFEPGFYVQRRFPDPRTPGSYIITGAYPGDRTAEPYYVDPVTLTPTMYVNCKVNLIDTGG